MTGDGELDNRYAIPHGFSQSKPLAPHLALSPTLRRCGERLPYSRATELGKLGIPYLPRFVCIAICMCDDL